MSWLEKIKLYYDEGLWSKERVWNVVGKMLGGKVALTPEEYEQITGESYNA